MPEENLFAALLLVVILAFLIERALALWIEIPSLEKWLSELELKPVIAFVTSLVIVWLLKSGLVNRNLRGKRGL